MDRAKAEAISRVLEAQARKDGLDVLVLANVPHAPRRPAGLRAVTISMFKWPTDDENYSDPWTVTVKEGMFSPN